jgi:hypothetical protein
MELFHFWTKEIATWQLRVEAGKPVVIIGLNIPFEEFIDV